MLDVFDEFTKEGFIEFNERHLYGYSYSDITAFYLDHGTSAGTEKTLFLIESRCWEIPFFVSKFRSVLDACVNYFQVISMSSTRTVVNWHQSVLILYSLKPYYYSVNPDVITGVELDQLLSLGWYRMHQYLFTCSHIGLEEPHRVHWLRYAINEITSRPSHRRIVHRCRNFHFVIEDFTTIRADHTELHKQYRSSIDFDGALNIMDCLFGDEETVNIFNTKSISVFDQDQLIAGGYFDVGDKAAASILHFFNPDYSRYSLGKYLILLTIDYLKFHHYEYYYPGYVVEDSPKMNYKLFLGKKEARYFDPLTVTWKHFDERILGTNPSGRSLTT